MSASARTPVLPNPLGNSDPDYDHLLDYELFYGTRLCLDPVKPPPLPSDDSPAALFKFGKLLKRSRQAAVERSGLIEVENTGDEILHPLPSEWLEVVRKQTGLAATSTATRNRGGAPRKLTEEALIQAEMQWPGADDASLGRKLSVDRRTVVRVRNGRPRLGKT